jgi:hypothetical protein
MPKKSEKNYFKNTLLNLQHQNPRITITNDTFSTP